MLHPITHQFLSKATEYDRSRQREVCQLRNRIKASGSASPSQIQRGMELLGRLLVRARDRLTEARIPVETRVGKERAVEG